MDANARCARRKASCATSSASSRRRRHRQRDAKGQGGRIAQARFELALERRVQAHRPGPTRRHRAIQDHLFASESQTPRALRGFSSSAEGSSVPLRVDLHGVPALELDLAGGEALGLAHVGDAADVDLDLAARAAALRVPGRELGGALQTRGAAARRARTGSGPRRGSPPGPATCSQKSRGSAMPNVRRSLSASALPTRISKPSNSTRPVALALAAQSPVASATACYARRFTRLKAGAHATSSTWTLKECASSATPAVDLAAEHRAGLVDRPVFGKVGDGRVVVRRAAARDGRADRAGARVRARARSCRGPSATRMPRFFAFINATADPVGIVADYLAASMNRNCWGGDHAAIHVERQVRRAGSPRSSACPATARAS